MRCHCSPADDRSRSIKVEKTFDPETLLLRDTPFGTQIVLQGGKSSGELAPALPRFVVKVAVPALHWPDEEGNCVDTVEGEGGPTSRFSA